MLTVVTDKRKIASARKQLIRQLRGGAATIFRSLRWPGPGPKFENKRILWRSKDRLWAFFSSQPGPPPHRRWNCWCGTELGDGDALYAVIEVNIPVAQKDRVLTGRVLEDETGLFYLGHKGELRGGRGGVVDQATFESVVLNFSKQEVLWPNGKTERLFVMGPIGSQNFVSRLQEFVSEAARMKRLAHAGELESLPEVRPFKRGTSGRTRGRRSGEYDINRWHDDVVNDLYAALNDIGIESHKLRHKDMQPDLYVRDLDGTLRVLFEVKTSQDTSALYGAIGQLVVYGAAQKKPPRRILVVESPIADVNFLTALKHLKISVLQFVRVADRKRQFAFPDLASVFPGL